MSSRKIFLRPEHSHPSSLWPSEELIVTGSKKRGFYLPEDIGIKPDLGNEILEWTRDFQHNFLEKPDSFHQRPLWKDQFDRVRWYEVGWDITYNLRDSLPSVQVVPQFSQFVFSINERRENFGQKPLCFPRDKREGYVCISNVRNEE